MLAEDSFWDASRHAEWMTRTAKELGPDFARLVGLLHEVTGPSSQASHDMDTFNNEVAVRAVEEGRPYRIDQLQLDPYSKPATPPSRPIAPYTPPRRFPGKRR